MAGTSAVTEISFGPFRLDASNARLLRDGKPVALTPKAFDVLHHLVSRPQRLVTKDELLSAVWPDVIVSDASVKVCVREIRKALDDGAKTPTYVETVHRRGYRFIANVQDLHSAPPAPAVRPAPVVTGIQATASATAPASTFVGRDSEMRHLDDCFGRAKTGLRQCLFISGGPGSGKTTLAEAFVARLQNAIVLAGHCFQHFGTSEPYMPVWEALGRLGPESRPPALEVLLSRHAAAHRSPEPPIEVTGPEPNTLLPRAASERLLRELADALETVATSAPLVLLLEDVHWADYSTIDMLSALARRRSSASLMVLATYRPAEILAAEHPLRGVVQGLLTAGLAQELALDFLEESDVAQYVAARFPNAALPAALPRRLHQRTDGHPLFLVHVVDDLVAQGVLVEQGETWHLAGAPPGAAYETPVEGRESPAWLAVLETQIPQTVRAMIELHLERLDRPARHALEAAAVAGMEFSAAAIAAALDADVVQAEQACEDLARRYRFLEPRGVAEWPDGSAATHYRFVHELYHNVVYEQIPIARRVRLHQSIGVRLESAWGKRAPEEAANLAMHFEHGRDWPRAVAYLRHAANAANRHYAHREAAHYLSRALAAVDRLPEPERAAHELDVLQRLGVNLQVTRGFAAHEVEAIHARAYALFRGDGAEPGAAGRDLDVATTFPVLWGIWVFHKVRSDLHRAREMSAGLLRMARASGDGALLLQAHQAMCVTHLCLGVPDVCREHMEQAAAVYDPAVHSRNTEAYGQDPGVATQAFGSVALWILGRPREALAASNRSLETARRIDQPSSTAVALHFAAMLHQLRGDAEAAGRLARDSVELSAEEGFSFWHAGAHILRGWSRVATATTNCGAAASATAAESDAGLADLRRGLDAWLATGSRTYHTYYLGLLADALQRLCRPREALRPLDEALSAAQLLPEGLYEAELYRLRGRSVIGLSGDPVHADAHDCFVKAVSIARGQGAKWFELRAATDLASLLRGRGQFAAADELLASATGQFDFPPDSHEPAADLCKTAAN